MNKKVIIISLIITISVAIIFILALNFIFQAKFCKNTIPPNITQFSVEDYRCNFNWDCKIQMVEGCFYISVNKGSYQCVDNFCEERCSIKPQCIDHKCQLKRDCPSMIPT